MNDSGRTQRMKKPASAYIFLRHRESEGAGEIVSLIGERMFIYNRMSNLNSDVFSVYLSL